MTNEIFERHYDDLVNLANFILRRFHYLNDEDREDARQLALLRAWDALKKYDETKSCKPTTWVYKRMRWEILNYLRNHQRDYVARYSSSEGVDLYLPYHPHDATDARLDIALAVKTLGSRRKHLWVLSRWVEGDSCSDISRDMNTHLSTIKLWLNEAKKAFRRAGGDYTNSLK